MRRLSGRRAGGGACEALVETGFKPGSSERRYGIWYEKLRIAGLNNAWRSIYLMAHMEITMQL